MSANSFTDIEPLIEETTKSEWPNHPNAVIVIQNYKITIAAHFDHEVDEKFLVNQILNPPPSNGGSNGDAS